MKYKIKIFDICLFLLLISLFKIYMLPKEMQQFLKVACIGLSLLFIFSRQKKERTFSVALFWGLWIIIASLYGYFNRFITIDNVFNSALHAVCIYCLFSMIQFSKDNGLQKNFINVLFKVLFIYNILSIISIFIVGIDDKVSMIYFAGDKFRTSYYLIMFVIVFYFKYKHKIEQLKSWRFTLFLLILVTIFTCYYIKCSTTVLGSLFLFLLLIKRDRLKRFLANPKTIFLSLFMAATILLLFQSILTNHYISYLITDILGENTQLTGRLYIYSYFDEVIKGSPLFGYGYGNSTIRNVVGYGNAQNAVVQLIVDYGLIGLVVFLGILKKFFKNYKNNYIEVWPFYVYLYVAIICSSVEISFNYLFYLTIFFIGIYSKNDGDEINEK